MGLALSERQMESVEPLVSVVIPTLNRPDLVVRAVASACAQTLTAIEVIVVIDGPDGKTMEVLTAIRDPRLRITALPEHVGPAEARNAGVKVARGQWVAFLDHDDEWMPEKLYFQLQTARQSPYRYPIIGCRLIVRHKMKDVVWPTRFPRNKEPISEYLFCRTQMFAGEAILQSSTIFAPRQLLQAVPFRKESQRHDDLDWVLRSTRRADVGVRYVPQMAPLVIWHRDDNRGTISSTSDWRFSFSWIHQNKELVTPRAYASFLMTWVSAHAVRERNRMESVTLIRHAFKYGRPSMFDIILFVGIWLMPVTMRTKLALRCSGGSDKNAG